MGNIMRITLGYLPCFCVNHVWPKSAKSYNAKGEKRQVSVESATCFTTMRRLLVASVSGDIRERSSHLVMELF